MSSGFYKTKNGQRKYYDIQSKAYKAIPGTGSVIILEHLDEKIVWQNSACKLYDIGDEVVALSWNTKMNTIGGEVLAGVQKSVSVAEEQYKGLVIANSGANFSAGANVGLIFMFAAEQEYDELDMAVRQFQGATMRLRYSSIPVVVAPHGLALGGDLHMVKAERRAGQVRAPDEGQFRVRLPLRQGRKAVLRPERHSRPLQGRCGRDSAPQAGQAGQAQH